MLCKSILLLIVISAFSSCTSEKDEKSGLQIAVSIFPVYDIVKNIAGDDAEVFFIVPPGANPHSYEPVPSVVKKIGGADLYIGVHPEFDGWIKDYLKQDAVIHDLIEEDHSGHDHAPPGFGGEEEEHQHEVNPHVWLSLEKSQQICKDIAAELSELLPGQSEGFLKRAGAYIRRLEKLHISLTAEFNGVKNRTLIQHHPAWDYFAADYGLTIVGSIEEGHGDNPSVKEFSDLISKGKASGVKVIVIGLNVESSTAESLARETGAELLRLDTLGDPGKDDRNSYLKLMEYNGRRLAEALKR